MPNGSGVTTVFVVRHAESEDSNPDDRDPHLTVVLQKIFWPQLVVSEHVKRTQHLV
jgi:hypothetical protein